MVVPNPHHTITNQAVPSVVLAAPSVVGVGAVSEQLACCMSSTSSKTVVQLPQAVGGGGDLMME